MNQIKRVLEAATRLTNDRVLRTQLHMTKAIAGQTVPADELPYT